MEASRRVAWWWWSVFRWGRSMIRQEAIEQTTMTAKATATGWRWRQLAVRFAAGRRCRIVGEIADRCRCGAHDSYGCGHDRQRRGEQHH
jgi:hypothetical protein